MRSLAHTGQAQRRKSTACACTSTSLWPKKRRSRSNCAGFGFRACSCDAEVGSFRFQCTQSHRTCLRGLAPEWSRYKNVCAEDYPVRRLRFRRAHCGRRWHLSVSAHAVHGTCHFQRAQSRRRCRQVFAGVLHAWVDFNFIAHRPLQLRRVSVSVRNQLPMRLVRVPRVQTVPS